MSNSSIRFIYDVLTKYAIYSNIFLLSVGLPGNLLLILIFVTLRIFRKNQCAFFLTVESIANIGVILFSLPTDLVTYITNQDPTLTSIVWCKMRNSVSQIFALCSLFTICFLAFDQFMSTNPRPNWRQISTLRLARYLTCINICFDILHSIPFFILIKIDPTTGCTIYNATFRAYFTYFFFPILSSTVPLLVTVSFSLFAYRNVRRIIRRQINVIRRRLDRQLTVMVLARVCCLILLGLPYIIYSVYRINISMTDGNQLKVAIADFLTEIVYLLLYTNFAINFYVYLIVSARFRRQVKHFLVKKCWKSSLNYLYCMKFRNRNRVQIILETDHRDISSAEST